MIQDKHCTFKYPKAETNYLINLIRISRKRIKLFIVIKRKVRKIFNHFYEKYYYNKAIS